MNDTSIYTKLDEIKAATEQVLTFAKQKGATAAEAMISRQQGLSVSTRLQQPETVEFNQDGAMGITLYIGQCKGSASTADLSTASLELAVSAAIDIARFTSEDEHTGLPDEKELELAPKDLELYHPHELQADTAIALCQQAEQAAFAVDSRVTNSDGASFTSHEGLKVYGNTHGQIVGYPSTRHSLFCSVIAKEKEAMERDYSYTISRDFAQLESPSIVGKEAADETLARLGSRKINTCKVPVLFKSTVANTLFKHIVAAIMGGNLYRKSSFLLDSIDTEILPNFIQIKEYPHLIRGLSSAPFDNEGVKTQERTIIESGVLKTYLLNSYSARKLGLNTTGHAGGIRNWQVTPTHGDFDALLHTMGTGLVVTELMGQGFNIVNGDYSRGAAGFWVENGKIQFPVSEITIAGNLKEMLKQIIAVGSDIDRRSSVHTGSVLIESMQIAGS